MTRIRTRESFQNQEHIDISGVIAPRKVSIFKLIASHCSGELDISSLGAVRVPKDITNIRPDEHVTELIAVYRYF